jgi:hypothetical protein
MIVIIELIFAFGVGVSCILFSFNLVKALRINDEDQTVLAPNNMASNTFNAQEVNHNTTIIAPNAAVPDHPVSRDSTVPSYSTFSGGGDDAELLDEERNAVDDGSSISLMEGILRNFTDYIRVW